MRKNIGMTILGATLMTAMFYEPARMAYGPVSLLIGSGIAVWRTGNQGL